METGEPLMEFEEKADVWEIRLNGVFNPEISARLYEELIAIVESPKDVRLDWSSVGRLDMAALQVLAAFGREIGRQSRRFTVSAASADLDKWLRLAGMEKIFPLAGGEVRAGLAA